MGREMISGPDLGGGYLHQLSWDGDDERGGFTYHAQPGGVDANGPPKGSPEPFGWLRFDGMCQFGGRLCWHRSFTLPRAQAMAVRTAYNRMRFVMSVALDQEYDHAEVPVGPALETVVDRAGRALDDAQLPWWVGGSSGLWLRGAPVHPRDIDIGTTAAGVRVLGESLAEYLTEPVAASLWDSGPKPLAVRAFVGSLVHGVRIESAALTGLPEDDWSEWGVRSSGALARRIEWRERSVPVSPTAFALVRAVLRGDWERAAAAAQVADPGPEETKLRDALLERAHVPDALRSKARQLGRDHPVQH